MVADLRVIIYIRDITISSSGKTVYAAGPIPGPVVFLKGYAKKWGLSAPVTLSNNSSNNFFKKKKGERIHPPVYAYIRHETF